MKDGSGETADYGTTARNNLFEEFACSIVRHPVRDDHLKSARWFHLVQG
jgi:hypothetical protein